MKIIGVSNDTIHYKIIFCYPDEKYIEMLETKNRYSVKQKVKKKIIFNMIT